MPNLEEVVGAEEMLQIPTLVLIEIKETLVLINYFR